MHGYDLGILQILIQQVGVGPQDSAFVTSLWVMYKLPIHVLPFK